VSGLNAQYTADQLRHFRSDERANDPNAMMRGISKRMTDAEIDAVAKYIRGIRIV
jgi:cytochrome c553